MKIALVDRDRSASWPGSTNRFAGLAALLRQLGHDVSLYDGAAAEDLRASPTLTGLNRAVAAEPMLASYRLGQKLAALDPDLVIAPLNGGLAQGVLMARACGEAFSGTRVALWCDTPSRRRFLRTDDQATGLSPLIADALERQALAMADALIAPDPTGEALQAILPADILPMIEASLPRRPDRTEGPTTGAIAEIVFVGPVRRGSGIVEFTEAIQRVASDGLLEDRMVTLLGPARSDVQGIGREWLGMRGSRWSFPFKVIDTGDRAEALSYVRKQGRLAITFVDDDEDADVLRSVAHHLIVLPTASAGSPGLVDRTEAALRSVLAGEPVAAPGTAPPMTDWGRLVIELAQCSLRPASQAPPARGVTVCVVHFNRVVQLTRALASIPDSIDGTPVEIIVLDNASSHPSIEEEIRSRAGNRPHLRIVRLARAVPQATALNLGLAQASYETVLFLDDDNYYLPSGVERLARGVAAGGFDIVVTALDLFDDGDSEEAPSTGRLMFMGQAHSAGLFFNAFGDTAMAVRRDTFLGSGGFRDPGYDYPSIDWVTLAKSQAAGLRIGALQSPAVRYHRDTARADMAANKLDQEGARLFVFEAYAGAFDAELLARYAQNLQFEEL